MREPDWKRIREAKDAHRDRMAALPFDEKVKLLERMRERGLSFGAQEQALRRAQREPTSNVVISSTTQPATQVANNAMAGNFGVFGATATLIAAMAPAQSSAVVTTITKTFTDSD
ncbi:MAG: hypothetical protein ACYC3F_01045 [Gemmatimonadaceae bacterium]